MGSRLEVVAHFTGCIAVRSRNDGCYDSWSVISFLPYWRGGCDCCGLRCFIAAAVGGTNLCSGSG